MSQRRGANGHANKRVPKNEHLPERRVLYVIHVGPRRLAKVSGMFLRFFEYVSKLSAPSQWCDAGKWDHKFPPHATA